MVFFNVLPQYLHPYTLAAVCIFSVLLSLHFLWYWQGEYTKQSKASEAGDHFLYSHDPYGWFNNHTVRRNKTLVTPTWSKGYVRSLSFFVTFHNTFKSYFVSLYYLFLTVFKNLSSNGYILSCTTDCCEADNCNGVSGAEAASLSVWLASFTAILMALHVSQLICELKLVKFSFCFRVWQWIVENTR